MGQLSRILSQIHTNCIEKNVFEHTQCGQMTDTSLTLTDTHFDLWHHLDKFLWAIVVMRYGIVFFVVHYSISMKNFSPIAFLRKIILVFWIIFIFYYIAHAIVLQLWNTVSLNIQTLNLALNVCKWKFNMHMKRCMCECILYQKKLQTELWN